jgi:serine/threonine protein kinase
MGKSGRSYVFQAIHKNTYHNVAIKSISLVGKDYLDEAKIDNEVHIMRLSVHNYVVRMLDAFKSFNEYFLVLEWESGGTFTSYLKDRNFLLKENRAR